MEIEGGREGYWDISTHDYDIKDYVIKNDKDEIIATVCYTSLGPGKSTRGHADDHNEPYFFMSGEGVMVVGKDIHHVNPSANLGITPEPNVTPTVFVKKGEFHRVLNISTLKNLNFLSVVPGIVKRDPYSAQNHVRH